MYLRYFVLVLDFLCINNTLMRIKMPSFYFLFNLMSNTIRNKKNENSNENQNAYYEKLKVTNFNPYTDIYYRH